MNRETEKQSIETAWPESSRFRRSIRVEFSIYISAIVLALMFVTGWVMTDMYVTKATEQVINEALVRVRSYSGPAGKLIISNDEPDALMLNNVLKKLSEDYPDTYWAGITDQHDVFLAHSDIKQVISSQKLTLSQAVDHSELLDSGETLCIKGDTIFLSVPIKENDLLLGTFALASSTHRINEARYESIKTVLTITLIMMLVGVPATLLVLHRKLRPVSIITDHLKEVSFDDISLNIPIDTKNEFGYLAKTLGVMGKKLNQARLDVIERERINRELEIAREIQSNMLPRQYPVGTSFQIAGNYRSAKEVGGDYYDFIEFDEENIGIIVADVSGKSLPGMLVMLLTRDIIKKVARNIIKPAELLTEVNAELQENIKRGMFVTMFYGVLNKKSGRLSFASAGHNPLIKLSTETGNHELIKTRGYPLGMMPTKQFASRIEEAQINLGEGDWIVQYTDGINEARNGASEEFGMERFISILRADRELPPEKLVARVMEGVEGFVGDSPQYDDITLLALKWTGLSVDREKNTVDEVRGTTHVY